MNTTFDVVIVGATTAVGEVIIELLQERTFPVGKVFLLDVDEAAGERISFNDRYLAVRDVAEFDFSQAQLALFVADEETADQFAPLAADAGCVVIDSSARFREDDEVPLVIAEVNPEAIAGFRVRNIIAGPGSASILLLTALKPLHDSAGIERINVVALASVSGSGKAGIQELASQTANLLNARPIESRVYARQIAFNVHPHTDAILENGFSGEEMKIVQETKKILKNADIQVNATVVRVPVFFGDCEAVTIQTRDALTVQQARRLLEQAAGIELSEDDPAELGPTPVTEAANQDAVFVGRIRQDLADARGISLWIVADNVRKGTALNSVQIAEILVKDYL